METLMPESIVKGETIADVKRRALGLGIIFIHFIKSTSSKVPKNKTINLKGTQVNPRDLKF